MMGMLSRGWSKGVLISMLGIGRTDTYAGVYSAKSISTI